MCFAWVFEQTSVIFLYRIKLLFLLTETDCVHCAVRADSSNMNQVKFCLQRVTTRKKSQKLFLPRLQNIIKYRYSSTPVWKTPQNTGMFST